jgi:hypothetical protein
MSEEVLNETKNSIYMPVQEHNGPGAITMENLGQRRKLWQPPEITSVFPQIYVYAISTPHPGIRETYKPTAQFNKIFTYREMEVRMRKNV